MAWLDERGQDWRDRVQVVAADPCAASRSTICQPLPNDFIAADQDQMS